MLNKESAVPLKWVSAPTAIPGVRLISRPTFHDDRGCFSTLFHVKHSLDGIPTDFAQENISISMFGVLRGMHLQIEKPQGKLVTCVLGSIWDVWMDLRPDSPTFMKFEMIELNSEQMNSVYVPPGLAHGFMVMSKFASVHYKTTECFVKELDKCFRWDSPEIREAWPEDHQPILSEKDRFSPTLTEFLKTLG